MGKAWRVPVLVDWPNVHPCFICAKSQLICGKKYLEGKIKFVTLAKYMVSNLHSESFTVCLNPTLFMTLFLNQNPVSDQCYNKFPSSDQC